ncbi:hypothetical protein AB1L88_15685 [Tautonia sp. JC769]|uniref:hypothetical protein n=1 Tax=Tautonia sp. JC769 TaxID=3232135 RepID=UPI00345A2D8A
MAGDAGPGPGDIEYRIYANDGEGGPIDLSAPWKTTRAEDSVAGPSLTPDAHWRFLVRAYDRDLGLEEDGTDAVVELITDGDGNDVTLRPRPVQFAMAMPGEAGELVVLWSSLWVRDARAASEFRVWAAADPGPIDFDAPPSAVVPVLGGKASYRVTVPGLTPGQAYLVAVRAANAVADDGTAAPVAGQAGAAAATGDAPVAAAADPSFG